MRTLTAIAIASLLGMTVTAQAQGTGQNDPQGQNDPHAAMPGRQNHEMGTTGQGGQKSGPGASEFAPGRNPGTANETNPGHGGTPPGQLMKKNNDAGSGTRL